MHRTVLGATLVATFAVLAPAPAAAQSGQPAPAAPQIERLTAGAFAFADSITVPGTPTEVFDAISGDLTPWWDHSHSENPVALYLEPKVGGCFCEVMDSAGNAARHAVVTYAHRGRMLRFEGPLGFTGHAVNFVNTYEFTPQGDSTRLVLRVRGAGEMQDAWPGIVRQVWRHFIVERFQPWYLRTRGRR